MRPTSSLQDPEGQLTLKIPYQPLYQLRPYQAAIFTILRLDGYRTEFRRGPAGTVDELVYHQPNGTFIARRVESGSSFLIACFRAIRFIPLI